ncbi:hypothetical protein H5410_030667 [Solanum commersonii]|uniref:Uncharacterized protein n=1 Tax=Solanum commersonii TaxID=4109 RepID=A0A9J5YGD1_SOLCO|nr:hypothetical protein H5410_030667 [Solanum commersonii]
MKIFDGCGWRINTFHQSFSKLIGLEGLKRAHTLRVGWAYPHIAPFRSGVELGVHQRVDLATLVGIRASDIGGVYLSHVASHVRNMDHVCLETYKDSGKRPCHHYKPIKVESLVPRGSKVGRGTYKWKISSKTSHGMVLSLAKVDRAYNCILHAEFHTIESRGLSVPLVRGGGFSVTSATYVVQVKVRHDPFYVSASLLEVEAPTIPSLDAICSFILLIFILCELGFHADLGYLAYYLSFAYYGNLI